MASLTFTRRLRGYADGVGEGDVPFMFGQLCPLLGIPVPGVGLGAVCDPVSGVGLAVAGVCVAGVELTVVGAGVEAPLVCAAAIPTPTPQSASVVAKIPIFVKRSIVHLLPLVVSPPEYDRTDVKSFQNYDERHQHSSATDRHTPETCSERPRAKKALVFAQDVTCL